MLIMSLHIYETEIVKSTYWDGLGPLPPPKDVKIQLVLTPACRGDLYM